MSLTYLIIGLAAFCLIGSLFKPRIDITSEKEVLLWYNIRNDKNKGIVRKYLKLF